MLSRNKEPLQKSKNCETAKTSWPATQLPDNFMDYGPHRPEEAKPAETQTQTPAHFSFPHHHHHHRFCQPGIFPCYDRYFTTNDPSSLERTTTSCLENTEDRDLNAFIGKEGQCVHVFGTGLCVDG